MFDFNPSKKKDQDKVASAMRGDARMRSIQDRMPIASVDGRFLRMKDGATCVYMTYPGNNLSLLTHAEKQRYALENGQVLSALQCDTAGIWMLPEPVSAQSNIILADEAAAVLRERVLSPSGDPSEDERCLEVLERFIRPEFAREAVEGRNISWRTYLGMRFERGTDEEIRIATDNIAEMIDSRTNRKPTILEGSEILDLIDLYFKGTLPMERHIGSYVVMPDIR